MGLSKYFQELFNVIMCVSPLKSLLNIMEKKKT